MFNRRCPLSGLLAVLLALAAQLGIDASVPRPDPIAQLFGLAVLCHPFDPGTPSHQPAHLPDCPICPACAALHTPAPTLVADATLPLPPAILAEMRSELPPPSRAPPARHRPPSQPRAPPAFS